MPSNVATPLTQSTSVNGSTSPVLPRMTYEEFLSWADEDTHAEWVDGEVFIRSPASDWHQHLTSWLTSLLRVWVETHNAGVVLPAPFQMKLVTRPSGREPDILFVKKEHQERLKETLLDGPADLVVEIISPESRARDRGDKYYEYEGAGIPEYWLLDPQRRRAEWYQLGRDGIYQLVAADENGIYRSRELEGLWLHESWLWQQPLPKIVDVLREWKII